MHYLVIILLLLMYCFHHLYLFLFDYAFLSIQTCVISIANQEFDEFGNIVSEVPVAMGDVIKKNPAEGRTWIGYFQDQYTRRSECTITAVMLSWWIAGIFKRFVTSSVCEMKSFPL